MAGAVFLEGEDVTLRTMEIEDAERFAEILNNRDVRRFLAVREPMNSDDEESFIENLGEENIHLSIYTENELIGNIVLKEKEEGVAEIGVMIDPDYHGNGYGTEASKLLINHGFEQMRYHRVYARVFASNEKSKSVWKKLGFQEEGLLREHIFMDGEFEDARIYGILEREWEN